MSFDCDILIVGGGTGGCAAAMAATSLGMKVVLTEETEWVGGQLTAQGVPPDEHPWIEDFGCTARYRQFRNGVRALSQRRELREPFASNARLNPGGGWVSRLCAEPATYHEAILAMLSAPNVRVLLKHKPVSVEIKDDFVRSVTLWNLLDGSETTLSAFYVLDATELGDLLPLSGAEYVSGAESKSDTGEPNAVEGLPQPDNVQGLTWCFAMTFGGPAVEPIRPSSFDKWRSYRPAFWPGPLLGFNVLHAHTGQARSLPLFREDGDWYALFPYRQIYEPKIYTKPPRNEPSTLVNWPQNDYFEASIIDVDPPGSRSAFPGASGPISEERLKESIALSQSLLYWLQTEAPRHDGGIGYPECSIDQSIWPGGSGFALYPYIRESRRIRAVRTVAEQEVAAYTNPGRDRMEPLSDSVGVGAYRIDLHPSTNGANTIDTSTLPFQIPLGSLIPVRLRNLLPACKNIGTTHITNGCYRLHPVEWNIGEAAGLLAAWSIVRKVEPRQTYDSRDLVEEFQQLLATQGVELAWPDVPLKPL